jgi:hypothetical protein
MITSRDKNKVRETYEHLVKAFKEVTLNDSNIHSYLGTPKPQNPIYLKIIKFKNIDFQNMNK